MNLSKHISELLKYHECVIVPEFGGFISNYQSARFDAAHNTFLPPSKEVIFNSKIRKNDGLLINHLVEAEQIGYHQAEVMVMTFVEDLFRRLNNSEKVELEQIGTIEYDRSGSVLFHATTSFELLQAYGLKEFQYPTLHENKPIGTFQPRPAVRVLNSRKDFIKIAASVALVLALSLFPVKSDKTNLHSSMLNPMEILMEETPSKVETNVVVEESATALPQKAEKVSKPGPFILVGGCFQAMSNASQFKNELADAGYNSEVVKLENGFYRVIIASYSSKEEALDAMTAYRSNHEGSGVWVSTR